MDIHSIFDGVLSGLLLSLILYLIKTARKQLRISMLHRARQTKEVLDETLLKSEEYEEILRVRKFFRLQGYGALFWLCGLLTTVVVLTIYGLSHGIKPDFTNFVPPISSILLIVSLALFAPLSLYSGYTPITAQEIEQKRQRNRARKFKEAQGARPYGYIFREIIYNDPKISDKN